VTDEKQLLTDQVTDTDKDVAPRAPVVVTASWSEQDELLRAMWQDKKTPEEIAAALGRSVAAIMTRAARLGLPRRMAPGRKRGYKRTESSRKSPVMMGAARVRVRVSTADYVEDEDMRPRPEVKMRVCLMCLNKFQSLGAFNRICPSCKGSAEYATGSSTPDFTFKVTT
jgi:hypothetical protein